MSSLYITHPDCHLHDMGEWHPESPQRLDAVQDQLIMSGVLDTLESCTARAAGDADLLRVHTPGHLQFLKDHSPARGRYAVDPDTAMNPHTLAAARVAAGAGLCAVDALMARTHSTAFCAVRPPGHHASPGRAGGFCFFNNIAVAAAYALEVHGLERVAIIDFDVHHGNGTEDAFAGDGRVLMCSFYQYPLYPGTRHDPAADNMINIPVPAGTGGAELRRIVNHEWMPRLDTFAPQMLFISAGFDAHREEELAEMTMVENDYAWITRRLVDLAARTAEGRIVSMLEGGYSLSALGRSVVAHLKAFDEI
ncbi:MAG: histone deacetylase family protein [Castellaniella sp.]